MTDSVFNEEIEFTDWRGRNLASMRIATKAPAGSDAIRRITPEEASAAGEHEVQLAEGRTYEFELLGSDAFTIDTTNALVRPALLGAERHRRGTIATGTATGSLQMDLLDQQGQAVASTAVEVRSSKLGYREEYRAMLEDVSKSALDIVLDLAAPTSTNLVSTLGGEPESLQQQFMAVRSLFTDGALFDALDLVLANPHSRLEEEPEERRIAEGSQAMRDLARQLVMVHPRREIPMSHPVASRLTRFGGRPTVPISIKSRRHVERRDTPENQFVKHVVESYVAFLDGLETVLHRREKSGYSQFASRNVAPLRSRLEEYANAPLFSEVSRPARLNMGSPVVQRRAGYREVLSSWLAFNSLLTLVWEGGQDVFKDGKKDVARLYEYWLLFFLLDVVERLDPGAADAVARAELVVPDKDGFRLRLKSGDLLEFGSAVDVGQRELRMQLAYNRSFGRVSVSECQSATGLDYSTTDANRGVWTRVMRPDFTFTVWSGELTRGEAESQGRIVHVHFDAKYRVNRITELFGANDLDVDELKRAEQSGTYRRGDLLKMHAYRDAIRRSEGAYVLYPGQANLDANGSTLFAEGFHELLPGLGAFVVRPGQGREAAADAILRFLQDVMAVAAMELID